MAKVTAADGSWTVIPLTAGFATLVEAKNGSVYVATNSSDPADKTDGYSLPSGTSAIFTDGLVVKVQPMGSDPVVVHYHAV